VNLIQQIQLPNGRSTSNLGFGCAGLLRLPTARRRDQLLRTVVEEGITHFDVARMYGSGEAEGIVGSSLKSFRDRITLATKFGLPYAAPTQSSLKIQSLAKWILNKSPALKNKIRKLRSTAAPSSDQPASPNVYSIEEMEKSLGLSLAQLQTDHVDILFLHAPVRHDNIAQDLAGALRQKKVAGAIGAFGISGYRPELEYFLQTRPDVCGDAIQSHFSVLQNGPESEPLRHGFTGIFGIIDGPLQQLHDYLSRNKTFTKSWSDRLGLDLNSRENAGIILLAMALTLNPQGLTIFFTSNPQRFRQTVRRLTGNSFSEENLSEFRRNVIRGLHAS
jgi:aryl-alcohol dehydrogenase-like predicted oxidoreductase